MQGQPEGMRFAGLRATRTATWKHFLGVLFRWLLTLLLSIAIWKVLWFYSIDLVIMASEAKREFNAWITGLTIALGLSLASSLNKLAKDIRWWILSRRYRSRRKVEAILQADNVLAVLRLALTSRRVTVHVVATLWVTVLLAVQVALAVVGLFYSVDPSDKLALIVFPGNVSVANMSAIQPFGHNAASSTSRSDEEYTSNIYGTMGLAYPVELRNSEPVIGDLRLDSDPVIFCDTEGCDLVMLESSVPSNPQEQLADFSSWRPMVVATNRKISIATTCTSYAVTRGGDGTATEVEYKDENEQELIRFAVPRVGASRQTIFMTDTSAECGSGCKTVHVLETSPDKPWFYACNTTVSPMSNSTLPEHTVSQNVRLLAAGAIALRGHWADSSEATNSASTQYQAYPAQSFFGTPLFGDIQAMALVMSRCAAGMLALVARTSLPVIVAGYPPIQASAVTVDHWDYIWFILTTIVCLQLVLSVVVVFTATRVVIPPEGATSIAKVLHLMVLDKDPGETEWIYRSRKVSETRVYDLHIDGRLRVSRQ